MMSKLGLWLILIAGALALGGWAAYEMITRGESAAINENADSVSFSSQLARLTTGEMATFEGQTEPVPLPADLMMEGPDGPQSLSDERGRVLLINLWAEWCAPCIEEMPTLAALDAHFGGPDFRVLPISIDRSPVRQAQDVLVKFKAGSLETWAEPSMKLMGDLGVISLPTTLLIDREGRELGRLNGPADWNSKEARALIAAAIKSTG
ncbi:thioredoxin [Iodidimonas nitroreducens]|uniref:Thioredoxin n=1 Tax=Iodidimonas nitroreducens TaxID=1236968 RepID=A0A5A7NC87_9PROT|nr:TlpA disulfide reductase family protein [Iodidimonas nitroreducens]GAK34002.1 thiol:disulfide interchange protein TlpA [alpha proteobacterium Q-1]GER05547.1 thioredoxin [Iodidimonas nitroreducens]